MSRPPGPASAGWATGPKVGSLPTADARGRPVGDWTASPESNFIDLDQASFSQGCGLVTCTPAMEAKQHRAGIMPNIIKPPRSKESICGGKRPGTAGIPGDAKRPRS